MFAELKKKYKICTRQGRLGGFEIGQSAKKLLSILVQVAGVVKPPLFLSVGSQSAMNQ